MIRVQPCKGGFLKNSKVPRKGIESSNLHIFATKSRRPQIFQTMNSARCKNLSLKYQRFAPSGRKNISIRKSEFVTKTQFLYQKNNYFYLDM